MGGANCFALAWPRQTESLAAVLDVDVEDGLEGVEVDLAVGYYFGEEFCEPIGRFGGEVGGSCVALR